jgi:DNA-binding HxlR family transcriptional regulator
MKSYGQFCSVARALDLLGERWTLLVVRELLSGTTRFNDIRRGIPRISRTMLAQRLRELLDHRIIVRRDDDGGPAYSLTEAGGELAKTIAELGTWGQRWLPRSLTRDELDTDALIWDVQRRILVERLPPKPIVVQIELSGAPGRATRFLLLRRSEVSLCSANPGFPVELRVCASLQTITAWWRGDISFERARASGLLLQGRKEWMRAFPTWFARYLFADVRPIRAAGSTDSVPTRASRRR